MWIGDWNRGAGGQLHCSAWQHQQQMFTHTIMHSDTLLPFCWDVVWHLRWTVVFLCDNPHGIKWAIVTIFVPDDQLLLVHYWADIVLSDPRIKTFLIFKILKFHTVNYHLPACEIMWRAFICPLIFMHFPSNFLNVWTMIKDILKQVLQPCKPKRWKPLPAAVWLQETNTSQPAFFVIFYFFYFHHPAFLPSLCSSSEEVQSYLHTRLILQRVF